MMKPWRSAMEPQRLLLKLTSGVMDDERRDEPHEEPRDVPRHSDAW
jgi:hypothetical protein